MSENKVEALVQSFSSFRLSGNYSGTADSGEVFTVSEDVLNVLIANITVSVIPFFNRWNASVNQTQVLLGTVYSFSLPLSVILPYSLRFAYGLLVLLLGLYSLYANGVSTTDGGFLQLLTTTAGSCVVSTSGL